MRVYYPINEFSESGYVALPLAVFLCDKLVLWSPMAKFIDDVYDKGKSILKSTNVLELIEAGYIQIAAREQWFDRSYRNKLSFSKASYTDFDIELSQLLSRSISREIDDSFVIVAPKETGSRWARDIIKRTDEKSELIVKTAMQSLEDSSTIPDGVYEKILRAPEEKRLRLLIQIMRNNMKTMDQIQCDNLIYWRDYIDSTFTISNYQIRKNTTYKRIDIKRFADMCDYLRTIVEIKDYHSFVKMLESRDIKEIKTEIARVLNSELSVNEEYLVWYHEVLDELKKRRGNGISLALDSCFTTAGIITLIAGLFLNPTNTFQFEISLYNTLSSVSKLGTIVSVGKTSYDLGRSLANEKVTTPVLPFIGGHLSDRNRIRKYKELILKTK